MMKCLTVGLVCVLLGHMVICRVDDDDEEYDPYTTTDPKKREPTPCEVCKFFITELRERLDKSARSKEIIATGHGLDRAKRFAYLTSELRLTEALLDPHICEKILEYNVHAERDGSNRYAKGQSETMGTLHGLVNKGVKVELGIPYELWDKPSAEVSKMHRICFNMAEKHEEDIEEWYYHNQDKPLADYICRDRYLKGKDQKCLGEKYIPKGEPVNADDLEDEKRRQKLRKKKAKKNKKGDGGEEGIPALPEDAGTAGGDDVTAAEKEPAIDAPSKADTKPAPSTEPKEAAATEGKQKEQPTKEGPPKADMESSEPEKEASTTETKQDQSKMEKSTTESDSAKYQSKQDGSAENKPRQDSSDQEKDDASIKKDEL